VIIYSIASEADLRTLLSTDWTHSVNGGDPPFGGVRIRHVKYSSTQSSVCFFAPREEPCSAIVQFLERAGLRNFRVDERPLFEGRDAAWRVHVESERIAERLIREGITVGMDKRHEYCVDWRAYTRSRKCHRCQRRTGHVAKLCEHEVRCGHCGRAHETRVCNSQVPSCANCMQQHAASSRQCSAFQQKIAIESRRLGVKIPPTYEAAADVHIREPPPAQRSETSPLTPTLFSSLILRSIEQVCSTRGIHIPRDFTSEIKDINTEEGASAFVQRLAEGLDTLLSFPPTSSDRKQATDDPEG